MIDLRQGLAAYLRQQAELSMPDVVFSTGFVSSLSTITPLPAQSVPQPRIQAHPPRFSPAPASAARPRLIENLGRRGSAAPATAKPTDAIAAAKRESLKQLFSEVRVCRLCSLSTSRRKAVFGAGNVNAPLLVVGEAPGAEEDEQGMPFVGQAGALLDSMLAAIQIRRGDDTFITNVLKCRPPENRSPESAEIVCCLPALKRQVEVIRPKAILLLGRTAAHSLLGKADSIQHLRTQTHAYEGTPAVVTYHPAALLRDPKYKRPAWEDLKKLQAILKDLNVYAASSNR